MNKIDEWMKRLRDMGPKPQERVRAFDRDVVMTRTQAHRFRELQDLGFPAEPAREPLPEQDWYTLDEASERLASDAGELLAAAAAGRLTCYVAGRGLRGRWADGDTARALPAHFVVTADSLGEIAATGSANVRELVAAPDDPTRFLLAEVQWMDAARLLLAHPLPAPGS